MSAYQEYIDAKAEAKAIKKKHGFWLRSRKGSEAPNELLFVIATSEEGLDEYNLVRELMDRTWHVARFEFVQIFHRLLGESLEAKRIEAEKEMNEIMKGGNHEQRS